MKIIIVVLILSFSLFGSNYVVVTSSKSTIKELSSKQLRDIFMMKSHYLDNIRIIPINTLANVPIREVFEKNILKMNRERLNNYWIKQHFQGVSPPVTQSSMASMKMFIKNVDGAIGYLPKNMIDSNLRVLYEF